MTKLKIVTSKIPVSNFAGAIPMHNYINNIGLPKLIREVLGERPAQSKYSFEEAIKGWIMTVYCIGFRLIRMEDAKKKQGLAMIPGLILPSHDTTGRLQKKLATPSVLIKYKNDKGRQKEKEKQYAFSENELMNDLLIKAAKKTGLLNEIDTYTVDIDSTDITSKTHDARMTFKGKRGYNVMVCMINNMPIHITMRGGNTPPHFKKKECLEKCLALLEKNNIKVGRVRIDGAGYNIEVTNYLLSKNLEFIIGGKWSKSTTELLNNTGTWVARPFITEVHNWDDAEFCEVPFNLDKSDPAHKFKVIAVRVKEETRADEKQPTKWSLYNGYFYKFIITNDCKTSPHDLHVEYCDRGGFEKNFDNLKNDFGWKILPYSNLNENLVYLIIASIAHNAYLGMVRFFSKVIEKIQATFTLDTFRRAFISAGSFNVIKRKLTFFLSEIAYEKLM